jgi:hypothetical protein
VNSGKNSLIHSVVCTIVFAIMCAIVLACGGGNMAQNMPTGNVLVRLMDSGKATMTAIPKGLSDQPLLATFFQSSPSGSQLQQSFGEDGPCLEVQMPPSGYIPFQGNDTGTIKLNGQTVALECQGVFGQVGGGVDEISGGTLTNPGYPMYFSGTLTTLVVTGTSVQGLVLRCSDLTTAVSVQDGQRVEAYYVIATRSVVLAIGTNQLGFTCNLNLPPTDQLSYIRAQWAKI